MVTELFLRGQKRNISFVLISQSYFKVSKTIIPNATHYFIMKIPNKGEFQQVASNHSSDSNFKDFMRLYKDYTKEPYSYLVNDANLPSDKEKFIIKTTITKKIKATNSKIEQNKAQYDLDRQTVKISALL